MAKSMMIKKRFQLMEQKNIDEEFNKLAKENGWYNGEAKLYAMKSNYLSWHKKEKFKFSGE